MNNLPKVVAQQRRGRGSNPRLIDRKSDALPLSHRVTLRAVNRSSGKCNKLSDGSWRVYNAVAGKQRSLLMAGNNGEMYDKKPQRYAEDNVMHET